MGITISNFVLGPTTPLEGQSAELIKHLANPLGPLELLPGTWKGKGFNQIWRPFHGSQDHFLELNETLETLEFTAIPGEIPNRGLLQADIPLFGITYLQQVSDANVLSNGKPQGIHIEPGIWIHVPLTTNPNDPTTVARLANIPHGTAIVAQGTGIGVPHGPTFLPASITPFAIGNPAQQFPFPESNLSVPSTFRTPPADLRGITQAMVDNPNTVLAAAIAEKNITSTTVLQISTTTTAQSVPSTGGGTSNIAFLVGGPPGLAPNAVSAEVDAIFWIETVTGPNGAVSHLLQYSQRVLLNFNGLSWPHISVATLEKQR